MKELRFMFDKYQVNVYVADRVAIDEPRTYAWEILNEEHIERCSYRDYDLWELNRALQDAVDAVRDL